MRVIQASRTVDGRKAHVSVQDSGTKHALMLARQKGAARVKELAERRAEHIRLFGEP
jgi:hypothetical protein